MAVRRLESCWGRTHAKVLPIVQLVVAVVMHARNVIRRQICSGLRGGGRSARQALRVSVCVSRCHQHPSHALFVVRDVREDNASPFAANRGRIHSRPWP
jgi:hypothetical protein